MSGPLRRLAVFTGSRPGADPRFGAGAYQVGQTLAWRGIGLVYGGGGSGLMGQLAQGCLDAGGEVVGVIPRLMVQREWGRHDLTELVVCDTMHERKALMADRADAFLALPGGLGTLEEIFEVWTWLQLGFHAKPVGFLNLYGFWTPLLDALGGLSAGGFIRPGDLDAAVVADTIEQALTELSARMAPLPHTLAPGT